MAQKIYEAMALIADEVKAIGKEKTNIKQNFKYRSIDQVYNDLQPLLAKNKVFTTPNVIKIDREERKSTAGGTLLYSMVQMQYTFWTVDGSNVTCSVIGEGMDSGDKATNKAMATAHKYALLQTFCIPTEDMPDPDAESHEIAKPQVTEVKKPLALKDKLRQIHNFDDAMIKLFYEINGITDASIAAKITDVILKSMVNDFNGQSTV